MATFIMKNTLLNSRFPLMVGVIFERKAFSRLPFASTSLAECVHLLRHIACEKTAANDITAYAALIRRTASLNSFGSSLKYLEAPSQPPGSL